MKTPFYYYDMDWLETNLHALRSYSDQMDVKVFYALKANVNNPILRLISDYGFGADCVSGNEIKKAIEIGFPPEKIVFAGVGKTDEEIGYALKQKIKCFNVESIHELRIIDDLSRRMGVQAPVALRINPDVDGHTLPGITTGLKINKFNIGRNEIPEVLDILPHLAHITFKGIHFHVGSQIRDMNVFVELSRKINQIQDIFIEAGFLPGLINLGGGLGIDYQNPDNDPIPGYGNYFKAFLNTLNRLPGQELYVEPGRSVVGQCSSLIASVLFLKKSGSVNYAIVDAGMNHFIRPALYHAEHKIQNLTGIGKEIKYHVAGPVCESSDIFGKNIILPELKRGDLLAIRSTGAYGEVMSSHYNLKEPAHTIYSHDLKQLKINRVMV